MQLIVCFVTQLGRRLPPCILLTHHGVCLQTNIIAMFDLVRFAKEHMPPGSSIINTSSVVAYQVR